MRLILVTAIASVAAVGIFQVYSTQPSDGPDNNYPGQYLRLAKNAPDLLSTIIRGAIPLCISETAQTLIKDDKIAELATQTYFKSGVLMSEERSLEESAEEMVPWIIKQAEPFNNTQKNNFVALLQELRTADAMYCVSYAVKKMIDVRLDVRVMTWELRESRTSDI
jgi:hypothetical protein